MRSRGLGAGALLMAVALWPAACLGSPGARPEVTGCRSAVVEGEVRAGQELRRSFAEGLELVLEPIAAGWMVRVIATGGGGPKRDYAEIATPPYRSVSPLLLSTDFSFRAQDAIGWNPRRFRYAANAREFARMDVVYRKVTGARAASPADEARLVRMVEEQPEGEVQILDAGLVPGTADPTRAASLVSSHFAQTAHRVEGPGAGGATPLGRITSVRVRVTLQLPAGVRGAPEVAVRSTACGER